MKDYYQILGVETGATSDEIKRAFKTLAKKHHPDANKGHKKAEEAFKEISEAYRILSHTESRREYDELRQGNRTSEHHDEGHPYEFRDGEHADFVGDLFRRFTRSQFKRNGFGRGGRGRGRGDLDDSFAGFADMFGSSAGGYQRSTATLKVPLQTACLGGQIQVSGLPGGLQTVTIPAGAANASSIHITTPEGPYALKLVIEDEPPFKVTGNTIETTVTINIVQAMLGSRIRFCDPRGEEIIVTVPEGTQPDAVLRLRKLGLAGEDLLVKVEIKVPKHLTEDQKQLLTEFALATGLKF